MKIEVGFMEMKMILNYEKEYFLFNFNLMIHN